MSELVYYGRDELSYGAYHSGFSLIELMIVTAIIGTLVAIAYPPFHQLRNRALFARAVGEIHVIQIDVLGYEATFHTTPPTLSVVGRGGMLDPWGNPYQYLSFAAASGGQGQGQAAPPGARMDKFLHPINTAYDLYSMGPDGKTRPPLTAKDSHDDVILANDGGFIGWARNY